MKKSLLRPSIAFAAFIIAAAYSGPVNGQAATNDPFSGEWAVVATPDEKAVDDGQGKFDEAVLFHDGQFSAAVFAMYGFTPAEYSIATTDGHTSFLATLASSDRGTLVWTGTETPTGLEGELVWTHADGHASHYALVGERQ